MKGGGMRLGDIAFPGGSHVVWQSVSTISGASTVFINGIPANRVGDGYSTHCLGSSCHAPVQATGSPTVIIEGSPAARIGDTSDCGMIVGTGSRDVFIGE
jgi:uncharacterized Zn-binding protein involved in type VI secretion